MWWPANGVTENTVMAGLNRTLAKVDWQIYEK